MELTIEQALQQGVAAHREGKFQDAERLYRAILRSQPGHPDANHNLGVLAVAFNKADAALPLFKVALEANPKIEQFWLSYIDALIKEQQLDVAKQALEGAKNQGVAGEKLNVLEAQLSPKTQKLPVGVSPPQELLNSLLEHYQNGRLSDAETLAISITQDFPKHQFAWKVLGAVLGATGRKSEAVDANQTAVALSPKDPEAHSNLGFTLHELGRLEEAEASCSQAIALKPDFAEAHNNLGNTLKELGRLDEAEDSYNKAIALKPDYAGAHSNLGVTLQELGRLEEAVASCNQAIALKPDYASVMLNLAITQSYMNDLEAEIISLQNISQIDVDDYGLRANVHLAICKFLEGAFTESEKHLFAATKIQEKTSSDSKSERVYWRYLSRILKWHKNKNHGLKRGKNDKKLYVIGESHSLTSHYLRIEDSGVNFFCNANLIKGCKQWHLGNAFRNKFKHQFETIFFGLPKHSPVLVAIGEIDCRLDTGIIAHKKKFPDKPIEEIILTTVKNYLTYIEDKNSDCRHNIIIQGVPCPNPNTRDHKQKDIEQLIEVIKVFNYELKIQSKEKGFGFLDTYLLTNRGDGISNSSWHIDDTHLSPEGMLEAWRRYGEVYK